MKNLILEQLSVDFRKFMWPALAAIAVAGVVSVQQACIFRWVSNSLLHFCCFFTSAGSSRAQLHAAAKQTAQTACRWSCDSTESGKEGSCRVIICVKLPGALPAHPERFWDGAEPMHSTLSWEQGPTDPAQGRKQQLNPVCLRGSKTRVWSRLKEVLRSQHLPSPLGHFQRQKLQLDKSQWYLINSDKLCRKWKGKIYNKIIIKFWLNDLGAFLLL